MQRSKGNAGVPSRSFMRPFRSCADSVLGAGRIATLSLRSTNEGGSPSPTRAQPTARRHAGPLGSPDPIDSTTFAWALGSSDPPRGTDPPRKKQRRRVSCETRRRHGISISSSPLTQPRGTRPARGRPLCYFFSASRNTFTPAPFSASSWAPFAASLSGLPIRYSRRNGANRLSPAASF